MKWNKSKNLKLNKLKIRAVFFLKVDRKPAVAAMLELN